MSLLFGKFAPLLIKPKSSHHFQTLPYKIKRQWMRYKNTTLTHSVTLKPQTQSSFETPAIKCPEENAPSKCAVIYSDTNICDPNAILSQWRW